MKRLAYTLLVVLSLHSFTTDAGPTITEYTRGGLITWTNVTANASYRLESATLWGGPYTPVTNLTATSSQVSVQVEPVPTSGMNFYRLVWTDPPPAQPLGEWIYQGYEPSGQLSVTGLVTFAQSTAPLTGTGAFKSIIVGNQRHRNGDYTFSEGAINAGNGISLPMLPPPFKVGFSISGVMVFDEFWGEWSYSEQVIQINGPGYFVRYSGRFVARRKI